MKLLLLFLLFSSQISYAQSISSLRELEAERSSISEYDYQSYRKQIIKQLTAQAFAIAKEEGEIITQEQDQTLARKTELSLIKSPRVKVFKVDSSKKPTDRPIADISSKNEDGTIAPGVKDTESFAQLKDQTEAYYKYYYCLLKNKRSQEGFPLEDSSDNIKTSSFKDNVSWTIEEQKNLLDKADDLLQIKHKALNIKKKIDNLSSAEAEQVGCQKDE